MIDFGVLKGTLTGTGGKGVRLRLPQFGIDAWIG